MLGFYNILLHLAFLVSLPLWPLVFLSKRGLGRGFSERLGLYPSSTTESLSGRQSIWIHAASVGEVKSAKPLIDEFKGLFPEQNVLLSTMTATGRKVAKETLLGIDAVVYFPLDLPWVVARTFRKVNPSLIVLLETEVWPNFIHTSFRQGIPVVTLSGRVSARSAGRYKRFAGVFVRVLREVSAFGMQDRDNAERLLGLGIDPARVSVTGSLKEIELVPMDLPGALATATGYQHRPVVVIGSTHKGEEALFVEALARLRTEFPDLLLIIAPRHPERFQEVEDLLRRERLRYRKRSDAGVLALHGCEVLLVDTLGELPWFYAWASVVFVGGTLVEVGGHNLLEPARLGKPILLGPHTENVAELANSMIHGGGALQVRRQDEVVHQLECLLADHAYAGRVGSRAQALATSHGEVLADSMALVGRVLGAEVSETQVEGH